MDTSCCATACKQPDHGHMRPKVLIITIFAFFVEPGMPCAVQNGSELLCQECLGHPSRVCVGAPAWIQQTLLTLYGCGAGCMRQARHEGTDVMLM